MLRHPRILGIARRKQLIYIVVLRTLHPALEDGTDRGFRNVGKPQSDAGEIPKRIYTIYIVVLPRHMLRNVRKNEISVDVLSCG